MSTPATGIELKLDNGMVIKGDTAEEALKNAAKVIEDNVKAYRETKASLDAMQGQFNQLQNQFAESQKPKVEPGGFDKDRYYQILANDPLQAQNYLDSYRLGISDPSQVPSYFQDSFRRLSELEMSALGANFANVHTDFPNDSESAAAMVERTRFLQSQGHPINMGTLDLAWSQLQAEGKIKPVEAQSAEESLPPTPTGAGGVIPDAELNKIDNMSMEQLQAYLKSKGML